MISEARVPPCPIYLFFYCRLRYILEGDEGAQGIDLPFSNLGDKDQEFVDDTNLYLKGTLDNFNKAKEVLDFFAPIVVANINWHKSNAIRVSEELMPFQLGQNDNLKWLALGKIMHYLVSW